MKRIFKYFRSFSDEAYPALLMCGAVVVVFCAMAIDSITRVPPPPCKWVVGDLVQLKSGGPVMTVANVYITQECKVKVEWFVGDLSLGDAFQQDAVRRAQESQSAF